MPRWSLIRLRFAVPNPFLALDFAGSGDEALGGLVLGVPPFLAPTFFCLFDDIDFGPRRNQNGSSRVCQVVLRSTIPQHWHIHGSHSTLLARACLPSFWRLRNNTKKHTFCRAFSLLVSWSQASIRHGCRL